MATKHEAQDSSLGFFAVKSIGEDRVGGYGVVWGSPAARDLTGDYFTSGSDLALEWYERRPILYHHGLDPTVKTTVIGEIDTMTPDDIGLWVEGQLNLRSRWAKLAQTMTKSGLLNWSSGSISHLVERASDGELKRWPIVEMTLTPAPAEPRLTDVSIVKSAFKSMGLDTARIDEGLDEAGDHAAVNNHTQKESSDMEKEEIVALVSTAVKSVLADEKKAADDAAAVETAFQKKVDDEVKKVMAAKGLPGDPGDAGQSKITEVKDLRFDSLSAADLATVGMVLGSAGKDFTEPARKALATKMFEAADGKVHALPVETPDAFKAGAIKALGSMPVKSNEVHQSTLASYGDEWVGVAYSSQLWESIRIGTWLLGRIPTIEVPAGNESIYIPLESGDPTWYKVTQTADNNATTGIPDATVTSSQMGTARQALTLAKLGARAIWAGEMDEDSLIPFAAQLRQQFTVSGQEVLEALFLNGDTESSASKNVNDIAGTPAATDYFMAFDGFRKLALVTNTANSRAGGALEASDYLETVKLMGAAGKNALDRSKIVLIVDPLTHYKSLELPEVKTRDVSVAATVESGRLTGLWGYGIEVSGQIAYRAGNCLSNTAGKVDVDTTGNNAYGQILAVRPDQWRAAFRRRMTMESTRIARSDVYEIVSFVRLGLTYRDTEAAAITYGLTV